jgi:hypothetical protein
MMDSPFKSRGFLAAAALGISLALLLPAQAQFWDWGSRPQRQQDFNPFGGWFGGNQRGDRWEGRGRERERDRDRSDRDRGDRDRADRAREAPVDYSHAPGPSQKKPEATTSIVVVGDANADWLAYGLEDAFSEKPEIAIVRKHRTDSGLIRYGGRGDIEWPQVVREIIAAEKPKFIIMMIGNNDRQLIREKAPPVVRPATPKANGQLPAPSAAPATPPPPVDTEQQPPEHLRAAAANMTPEQVRQASYGPWEFHTEKWELAYIKRVDATIAALKSAGVPVLWVGLPSQRGTKASSDSSYLNEIYRSRAGKAGIFYVDIWDGFVDEAGLFSPQGPDYEGQIRRLRTNDGVYFTKFGARKLAHYAAREIDRSLAARSVPVALPVPGPQPAPNAKQGSGAGGGSQRPMAGPVVPLTATNVSAEELLGGSRAQPSPTTDAMAIRVLTKGEPVSAPSGRADDFSWPHSGAAADPAAAELTPATPVTTPAAKPSKPAPAAQGAPSPHAQQASQVSPGGQSGAVTEQKPQVQRRVRTNSETPRPLLSIQGLFR